MDRRKTKEEDDLPRYLARMIEYARSLVHAADAEDVALEALNDAYAERQPRPPAPEEARVKAWLFKLVELRAKAHRKAQKKRAAEVLCERAEDMAMAPDPIHLAKNIEDRELILLALPDLSEQRQAIVISNGVEGVKGAVLAREYGVSRFTMQSWLRRSYADLGSKMRELLADSRRRLGMLLPFDLFGWFRFEEGATGERWWLRFIFRFFGPPLRLGSKVGVVACIVGFTPSGPCSMGGEQIAGDVHAVVRGDVVITRAGAAEPVPVVTVQSKAAESAAPKASHGKRPTSVATADDEDFALLVHAKASFNRRELRKALAYLDEHASKFPKSENARERELLRAAVERALCVRK